MTERMPCGHGSWSVATSSEGTNYCQECERIGRLEADLKDQRRAFLDEIAEIADTFKAELEQLRASREVWATRASEQEARAEQAEEAGREYIKLTDPLLACGPVDEPAGGCGTCRACLMLRHGVISMKCLSANVSDTSGAKCD